MAKKKSTRKTATKPAKSSRDGRTGDEPPKKASLKKKPAAGRTGGRKKTVAKKSASSKAGKVAKKRRPRSRGKARNTKTAGKHAANAVEAASKGEAAPDSPEVEIPESFRPGPSVEVLDGTASVNQETLVIRRLMNHPEWNIPEIAFSALPNKLVAIALNLGEVKDDQGNVIQENAPDAGTYSTNQQLTAIRMLKEFNEANLKKVTSLKPNEVRVLNEQQTTVTVIDQRTTILAAISAELSRRQSGGTISDQPDSDGDRGADAGADG